VRDKYKSAIICLITKGVKSHNTQCILPAVQLYTGLVTQNHPTVKHTDISSRDS